MWYVDISDFFVGNFCDCGDEIGIGKGLIIIEFIGFVFMIVGC